LTTSWRRQNFKTG